MLLANNLTNISIDLVKIIDDYLLIYAENKDEYDSQGEKAV